MGMAIPRQQIIKLLIERGVFDSIEVEEAFSLQKKEGQKFSSLLIKHAPEKKDIAIEFINRIINPPAITVSQLVQLKIPPEVLRIVTFETASCYHILPIIKQGNNLNVVLDDPFTILDLEDVKELQNYVVNPIISPKVEFMGQVELRYSRTLDSSFDSKFQDMDDILSGVAETLTVLSKDSKGSETTRMNLEDAPVIKAANLILEKAVEARASDILIEPLKDNTRVRFRLDGILQQFEVLPKEFHQAIISRIKVISGLDIAERRLPQDGQFKIKSRGREVEFRVSTLPVVGGEKAVLRVLDKSLGMLNIDKCGIRDEYLEPLKKAAASPYGMILMCGPTCSGKTSTLYSLLNYIHTPEKNTVTVEDPVEYQIKGLNQVSVNSKTGLTFTKCLRSILRQDPDIIMIGEIRDFETMDIAIKAALTGHLVLSTLHTTTAPGSVVRMVDMGVQPFLINASVIAVIAQRLARKICVNCRQPVSGQPYFTGAGCRDCFQTGYSGRTVITEILYMNPEIRDAVAAEELDENKIKNIARACGMRTLREEGEFLARQGITTMEEVYRLTPSD